MDRSNQSWFLIRLAHWRAGVLGTLVVVCGLTLNLTVLGSNPAAQLGAGIAPAVSDLAPVSEALTPDTAGSLPAAVDGTSAFAADEAADPILDIVPVSGTADRRSAVAAAAAMVVAATGQTAVAPQAAVAAAPTTVVPVADPVAAVPTTVVPVAVSVAAVPTTVVPVAVPVAAVPTTVAPTTVAPTTAPPTTAVPTTAAPQIEYITYTVEGGVGSVVLARQGNNISLYGFYPSSGWVKEVVSNGPSTVKLKFFNVQTGRDHEWVATVQGGRILVEN